MANPVPATAHPNGVITRFFTQNAGGLAARRVIPPFYAPDEFVYTANAKNENEASGATDWSGARVDETRAPYGIHDWRGTIDGNERIVSYSPGTSRRYGGRFFAFSAVTSDDVPNDSNQVPVVYEKGRAIGIGPAGNKLMAAALYQESPGSQVYIRVLADDAQAAETRVLEVPIEQGTDPLAWYTIGSEGHDLWTDLDPIRLLSTPNPNDQESFTYWQAWKNKRVGFFNASGDRAVWMMSEYIQEVPVGVGFGSRRDVKASVFITGAGMGGASTNFTNGGNTPIVQTNSGIPDDGTFVLSSVAWSGTTTLAQDFDGDSLVAITFSRSGSRTTTRIKGMSGQVSRSDTGGDSGTVSIGGKGSYVSNQFTISGGGQRDGMGNQNATVNTVNQSSQAYECNARTGFVIVHSNWRQTQMNSGDSGAMPGTRTTDNWAFIDFASSLGLVNYESGSDSQSQPGQPTDISDYLDATINAFNSVVETYPTFEQVFFVSGSEGQGSFDDIVAAYAYDQFGNELCTVTPNDEFGIPSQGGAPPTIDYDFTVLTGQSPAIPPESARGGLFGEVVGSPNSVFRNPGLIG